MKLLLTGAAGKLGSATYKELLNAGFDVRATDAMRRQDSPGKIAVGDLTNREFCYNILDDVEVVVHVANLPNQNAGTPQKVFNDNVTMNMNVFQAALESGVKKIVYASSVQAASGARTAVSAQQKSDVPYLPLDGEILQNPGNAYALSKCVGEQQLQYFTRYQKLASAVALRFPALAHPNWFAHWKNRATPLQVDPYTLLDEAFTWLSVHDAAMLLVAVVKADLPGYRVYFPVHPTMRVKVSVREIIEKYFAGTPLKKPIEQMDSMADISRITAETGWTPMDNFWKD